MNYVVYDAEGRVVQHGTVPDEEHFNLVTVPDGCGIAEAAVVDERLKYYPGGVPTPRPNLSSVATWSSMSIVGDGTDFCTLGPALPNPTEVLVVGPGVHERYTVTTGQFVFSATLAGTYTVVVDGFPYLPRTTYIEVAKSPAQEQAETRRAVMQQIFDLERQQARSIREMTLSRGDQRAARERLEALDDQITALRAQLP